MFVAKRDESRQKRSSDSEDCTAEWTQRIYYGGLLHVHSQVYQVIGAP